jgi:uroporphyrin-III C-methyltransferase / precorrin-2 dehydrogenase / sirohydrochlorin ferrochelatase
VPVVGHVSLVGAGPGDPDLLTRRAASRLRAADLVLYDALVDPRVLAIARRAQRFFVGKRAGRHALSQTEIHGLMIRAARRGRRVVRLKGGDPFVLGRGGEEAMALQAAGVPFDVVPGVTSLLSGPTSAGIPVTHRGRASSVLVTTGHDVEAFTRLARGVTHERAAMTLVVAMGFERRRALAAVLVAEGWPEDTPAAIVAGASYPGQRVWRGSLASLAAGADEWHTTDPALLVIGGVASLDVTSMVVKPVVSTLRSAARG